MVTYGLSLKNEASTSSSLSKFFKATLSSSPSPCKSFKTQDSNTKSLKNLKANREPLKVNISKAQGFKTKANKPQPHHAFMYHNKRHTHMHDKP